MFVSTSDNYKEKSHTFLKEPSIRLIFPLSTRQRVLSCPIQLHAHMTVQILREVTQVSKQNQITLNDLRIEDNAVMQNQLRANKRTK